MEITATGASVELASTELATVDVVLEALEVETVVLVVVLVEDSATELDDSSGGLIDAVGPSVASLADGVVEVKAKEFDVVSTETGV